LALRNAVVSCPKCSSGSVREVGENRYLCLSCGYAFYACPVCGKTFEQPFQLAGHMRSHRRRQDLGELMLQLLAEIEAIREELRAQRALLERLLAEYQERNSAQQVQLSEWLPEFLRGNPWLSILHSRAEG
jgi:transposase-like protein